MSTLSTLFEQIQQGRQQQALTGNLQRNVGAEPLYNAYFGQALQREKESKDLALRQRQVDIQQQQANQQGAYQTGQLANQQGYLDLANKISRKNEMYGLIGLGLGAGRAALGTTQSKTALTSQMPGTSSYYQETPSAIAYGTPATQDFAPSGAGEMYGVESYWDESFQPQQQATPWYTSMGNTFSDWWGGFTNLFS